MLTKIQERKSNVAYLAHVDQPSRRNPRPKPQPTTQAIRVAEGVTVTTSNPATYTRLTGIKVQDHRPKRPGKTQHRRAA